MVNFSLKGKIALVTGAAHGIGYAIAKALHEAGATIVFNSSNEESLARGLAAYATEGMQVYGYVCDVTDEAAVAAFKETQSAYGSYGVPDRATYDMQPVAFNYICPVMGTVTSHFGYRTHPNDGVVRFHYGTDIGAREGTEILSFGDGRVKAVGNSSSYGKYVMVDHGENTVTMYAHCSAITVSEGDRVLKGDKIAESGSTGNATGDCVHFEVIVVGKYVNPEYYVSWS